MAYMAFIRIAMMMCVRKGLLVADSERGRFYCRNKPRRRGGNARVSRNSRFIGGQIGTPFSLRRRRNIVLEGEGESGGVDVLL